MAQAKSLDELSARTGISVSVLEKAQKSVEQAEWVECNATTVEEARCAHSRAPQDSNEERAALEKWITLCSTAEEAEAAYICTPEGRNEERAALEKWITLCSTVEEVRGVYVCTANGSYEERAALLKMIELYQGEEE